MLFLLTVCKLRFLLVESPFFLDQSQLLKSSIDDYIHANRWRLNLMIWQNKGRFRIPPLVLVVLVRFLWGPCETAIISPKIIMVCLETMPLLNSMVWVYGDTKFPLGLWRCTCGNVYRFSFWGDIPCLKSLWFSGGPLNVELLAGNL